METYDYQQQVPPAQPEGTPQGYTQTSYVVGGRPAYGYPPYAPYQPQYTPAKQKKEKRRFGWGMFFLCLFLMLVSVAATAFAVSTVWQWKSQLQTQAMNNRLDVLQQQIQELQVSGGTGQVLEIPTSGALTPGQIYAKNVDAVVAVTCTVQEYDYFSGQYSTYESSGSGFIVSPDGYVVSNCHVVEGAESVVIHTSDDQEYTAQVIGTDETNDVSLLKIQGEDFPCVELGSSSALVVGDQVVAIGNPLGELTSTLTVGYISAKDRVVTTDGTTINMLQTDAAINSGNSGGPLFNAYGQVIGITTAKYSGTSGSGATIEGIGFAIPIDDVVGILEDLEQYGYVKSSYLGITCREVSAAAVRDGLPAGVYVEDVVEGLCAEAAGLQRGDIIVDLGGYQVSGMNDLTRALRKIEPGTETTITVYRMGQEAVMGITLNEKPHEPAMEPAAEQQPEYGYDDQFEDYFG